MKLLNKIFSKIKEPVYTIADLPVGYKLEKNGLGEIRWIFIERNNIISSENYFEGIFHTVHHAVKHAKDREKYLKEFHLKNTWTHIHQDEL